MCFRVCVCFVYECRRERRLYSIYRKAIRKVRTFFCSSEWTTKLNDFFLRKRPIDIITTSVFVHFLQFFFLSKKNKQKYQSILTKEIPSAFRITTPLLFNLWLLSLFLSKVQHVINWIMIWKPKKSNFLQNSVVQSFQFRVKERKINRTNCW